jgi:hypothetical protein
MNTQDLLSVTKTIHSSNPNIIALKQFFLSYKFVNYDEDDVAETKNHLVKDQDIMFDELYFEHRYGKGEEMIVVGFLDYELELSKKNVMQFLDLLEEEIRLFKTNVAYMNCSNPKGTMISYTLLAVAFIVFLIIIVIS